MELTRRNLFKLGALTGAAATLPRWAQKVLPAPFRPEVEPLPLKGEEQWLPAVCRQCGAGCGLLVRVIKGQACGIKGDPNHPISQGALCPKGAASLQELYHPDRVRQPLQRVGERGAGKWKPISWDDALNRLTDRLDTVHQQEPSRLGILLGQATGVMRSLWQRFADAFGTPHLYEVTTPRGGLPNDAAALMMGAHGITFDLSRAEFVLSFCDWLQGFPNPIEASRAFGKLRRGRADRRVRIVSVEPRLSVTAAKADEWISIRPGTEGALALGIAHVLIQETLYDAAFVREHTQGFEGFKALVLSDYAPERIADATGVPPETVQRLAKEFAAHQPALALCDGTDLFTQMATLALNALVGNIGSVGGVRQKLMVNGQWLMVNGQLSTQSLTINRQPLTMLLLHHANPLFIHPNQWREAWERTRFIVSITSFMDDTAQHADLILPDHTPLEALTDASNWTLNGSPVLSVSNPVVKPLYNTRHTGDMLIDIAHRLGEPIASKFASLRLGGSFEDTLKEATKPLYDSKRGNLLRKIELETESWSGDSGETFDQWFQKLGKAGGWADLSAEGKPQPLTFSTPSGKFEFRPDQLTHHASRITFHVSRNADFPLHLCLYVPLVFAGGEGAHLPFLQSIAGAWQGEQRWDTWVEIHPKTAKASGIADGDAVKVESSVGSIRARAKLTAGARQDTVNIAFGLGHTAYGRWAQGVGANPAELLGTDTTTGEPLWQHTQVRIVKAGEPQ